MPKIKRKVVHIKSRTHKFQEEYDKEMTQFDDVRVLDFNLVSRSMDREDYRNEVYLVFYEENQETTTKD